MKQFVADSASIGYYDHENGDDLFFSMSPIYSDSNWEGEEPENAEDYEEKLRIIHFILWPEYFSQIPTVKDEIKKSMNSLIEKHLK